MCLNQTSSSSSNSNITGSADSGTGSGDTAQPQSPDSSDTNANTVSTNMASGSDPIPVPNHSEQPLEPEPIPSRPMVSHTDINNNILLAELRPMGVGMRVNDPNTNTRASDHMHIGFFPSLFTLQLSMFTNYIWSNPNAANTTATNTTTNTANGQPAGVFHFISELFDYTSEATDVNTNATNTNTTNATNAYDDMLLSRLDHQQRDLSRLLIGLGFFVLFCLLFI